MIRNHTLHILTFTFPFLLGHTIDLGMEGRKGGKTRLSQVHIDCKLTPITETKKRQTSQKQKEVHL